jgi:hypothetical protein
MILQKPISRNDIVTMKLLTGEEILCTYLGEELQDEIEVGKPATIAQGPQGMGIIPWMMTSKAEKLSINKNTVIAMAPTDEEIAKAYTEATTNIQLVT